MSQGTGTGPLHPVREWWVPTVSLMLLGALTTVVWIQVTKSSYALLDILLPTTFVALTVWHGLQFRRSATDEQELNTVVRWFTLGIVTMFCLGMWPIILRTLGQSQVPVGVRLLTEIIAGGLLGLLVGRYSVRARRSAAEATQAQLEQTFLEQQREINDVLNGMLRHHVLNSLTVIRGRAELLERRSSGEQRQWAQTVVARADEMAATVEEIATITRTLTDGSETEVVPLAVTLESSVENVRSRFDSASIELDEVPDCDVLADDVLGQVFEEVLANAIEHNDSATPRVVVDVTSGEDAVAVTVVDNGPGVPVEARERVFAANERGLESDGAGLGLYLAAEVLDQYGGDIRVRDAELGGATFELTIPLAGCERTVPVEANANAGAAKVARKAASLSLL